MKTKNKPVIRWLLIMAYLGLIGILVACAPVNGPTTTATAVPTVTHIALRLDRGAVEVQDQNKAWVPVAGETTFEIVGKLESLDPWKITGNTFAARDTTQIDKDLKVGDIVRVKGVILADGTWLASSIERAENPTNPTITLIGKVTSVNPWVVSGITLKTTSDTVVTGDIKPGMMVRVEILLLQDGTWEVVSITPLGNFTGTPGCATVMAKVDSVNGKEIQLVNWPVIQLGEDVKIENDSGGEGTLKAGQSVLVVVCGSDNGQIAITHIIILSSKAAQDSSEDTGKVVICHKPDKKGGHTLTVDSAAVPAHMAHGDKMGPCP